MVIAVVKAQIVEEVKFALLKKIIKEYKLIKAKDKKTMSLLLQKLFENILGLISKKTRPKNAIPYDSYLIKIILNKKKDDSKNNKKVDKCLK